MALAEARPQQYIHKFHYKSQCHRSKALFLSHFFKICIGQLNFETALLDQRASCEIYHSELPQLIDAIENGFDFLSGISKETPLPKVILSLQNQGQLKFTCIETQELSVCRLYWDLSTVNQADIVIFEAFDSSDICLIAQFLESLLLSSIPVKIEILDNIKYIARQIVQQSETSQKAYEAFENMTYSYGDDLKLTDKTSLKLFLQDHKTVMGMYAKLSFLSARHNYIPAIELDHSGRKYAKLDSLPYTFVVPFVPEAPSITVQTLESIGLPTPAAPFNAAESSSQSARKSQENAVETVISKNVPEQETNRFSSGSETRTAPPSSSNKSNPETNKSPAVSVAVTEPSSSSNASEPETNKIPSVSVAKAAPVSETVTSALSSKKPCETKNGLGIPGPSGLSKLTFAANISTPTISDPVMTAAVDDSNPDTTSQLMKSAIRTNMPISTDSNYSYNLIENDFNYDNDIMSEAVKVINAPVSPNYQQENDTENNCKTSNDFNDDMPDQQKNMKNNFNMSSIIGNKLSK